MFLVVPVKICQIDYWPLVPSLLLYKEKGRISISETYTIPWDNTFSMQGKIIALLAELRGICRMKNRAGCFEDLTAMVSVYGVQHPTKHVIVHPDWPSLRQCDKSGWANLQMDFCSWSKLEVFFLALERKLEGHQGLQNICQAYKPELP